MRRTTTLLLVLLCALWGVSSADAQDMQTLFDGDVTHGGFGGPVIKFSEVAGDPGVWVGGRGGWIINFSETHAIGLGGGGYGLTTFHNIPEPTDLGDPGDIENPQAVAGYGGFELEYTSRSYRLLHWTATTLIGAGSVSARSQDFQQIDEDFDPFFVIEPGLHGELNLTSFMRLHAGVSYRWTSGIDQAGFTDSDFSGINGTVAFKFGSFL